MDSSYKYALASVDDLVKETVLTVLPKFFKLNRYNHLDADDHLVLLSRICGEPCEHTYSALGKTAYNVVSHHLSPTCINTTSTELWRSHPPNKDGQLWQRKDS